MANFQPPDPAFFDFAGWANVVIRIFPDDDMPTIPLDPEKSEQWADWFSDVLVRPSFIDFRWPNPYNYSSWQEYARDFTFLLNQQI